MIEAYREELAELTARAEKYLRHPKIDLPHRHELLRLWRYPSFAPYVSWRVYTPFESYVETDLPIAVRVTWDRPFDYSRFRDPMKGLKHGLAIEPTVERKEAELSRSELDSRLAALRTIKIPVVIDRSVVLDGVSFGLEVVGSTSVRLEWRSIMSDGLKPMINWAAEMTSFLDETLEAR